MQSWKSTQVLLAAMVAAIFAPLGMAQMNIAFVDSQSAIMNTAEIAKEQAALQAKFQPRYDELQQLQTDLQDIDAKLNGGAQLTPQQESDLQVQGQRKQRDYQRKSEDLNTEVENQRNDVLTRVADQMRTVVTKMAEDKGLDAILDSSGAVYVKPALDLTAEATAAYDAAYPVN